MNHAFEKTATAIKSITGNENLANLIKSSRIGIRSEDLMSTAGEIMAKALGEYLGRFWHQIDADGCHSKTVMDSAVKSARACKFNSTIREQWDPPYDFVIGIGTQIPSDEKGISVGADGWKVNAGRKVHTSDDPNPVGPCFASALASAQAFTTVFHNCILDETCSLPEDYEWNSWYGCAGDGSEALDMEFDKIHVFGVGAVSHGFFWILQNWPGKVRGTIHLIDPDCYDAGNAQRYMGMAADWVGKPKAEAIKSALEHAHPELNVISHNLDMNSYFDQDNRQCHVRLALCGLDSKEGRRQLALKLPEKTVNMWTDVYYAGSTRFSFGDDRMCLYCAYPEPVKQDSDETSVIHKDLGLNPARVRDLLYSGAGIDHNDAEAIRKRTNVQPQIGTPLRSVMGNLCATGNLSSPQNMDETTTPLPFSSGIAGILGFIEMFREINHVCEDPIQIQIPLLKYPTDYAWRPQTRISKCYLCSDSVVHEIIQEKYNLTSISSI